MLCQKCGQKQATCHFAVNHNGTATEAHLCADCAGEYAGQYRQMVSGMFPLTGGFPFEGMESAFAGIPSLLGMGRPRGWFVQPVFGAAPAATPEGPATQSPLTDPEFQNRRERELLRGKLRAAVDAENFEEAATLRDQIKQLESGATTTEKDDIQ